MAFLLDTNVLSEAVRPHPAPEVMDWLGSLRPLDAFISVLTLGEIGKGVALMVPGPRRLDLEGWLSRDLPHRIQGRVLDVDADVARAWGILAADGRRMGRPLPVVDGLLLATAKVHGLTFVSRDICAVADRGVPVLTPWG